MTPSLTFKQGTDAGKSGKSSQACMHRPEMSALAKSELLEDKRNAADYHQIRDHKCSWSQRMKENNI